MNKVIGYLKTKPKISLTTLIIILLFLKYVTPISILMFTPLLMGSVTPQVSYNETEVIYNNMAKNLAESFSDIMKKMYLTGQKLSRYSLFLRVFFYGIVWVTYIAIISFVLYIIRIVIYWGLNRKTTLKPTKRRRTTSRRIRR